MRGDGNGASDPRTQWLSSRTFLDAIKSLVGRGRGAPAASGTRRESVHGGSVAGPCRYMVPQSARTPHRSLSRLRCRKHAHRHSRPDRRVDNQLQNATTSTAASTKQPAHCLARRPRRLRDRSRHGCHQRAPRDGFTACPASGGAPRTRPTNLWLRPTKCDQQNHCADRQAGVRHDRWWQRRAETEVDACDMPIRNAPAPAWRLRSRFDPCS